MTTSGGKFDLKFDFCARFPIYQEMLEIGPRFHVVLADFLLRMRRNGQNFTSGEIFNPKFEIPMGGFLLEYESVSYTHLRAHETDSLSRMPSSA